MNMSKKDNKDAYPININIQDSITFANINNTRSDVNKVLMFSYAIAVTFAGLIMLFFVSSSSVILNAFFEWMGILAGSENELFSVILLFGILYLGLYIPAAMIVYFSKQTIKMLPIIGLHIIGIVFLWQQMQFDSEVLLQIIAVYSTIPLFIFSLLHTVAEGRIAYSQLNHFSSDNLANYWPSIFKHHGIAFLISLIMTILLGDLAFAAYELTAGIQQFDTRFDNLAVKELFASGFFLIYLALHFLLSIFIFEWHRLFKANSTAEYVKENSNTMRST